jgi:7-carboxy-7-deazaguanine synthase
MKQPGAILPLMEQFSTVQGEGQFVGAPSWFIRLGGCDVGCHWCDVKESWDALAHPSVAVEDLADAALDSGRKIVVVTGGEPTMYDLAPLTAALRERGLRTHIETSGAHPLTGQWDWVTLSPKKFKACLPGAYLVADELKIVVFNRSDLAWSLTHAEQVGPECALYLQPEWDKRDEATWWILSHLAEHPAWRLSLQVHKFLGLP